ncbi:Fic/DOC family protein [Branchiibius hedensis]|uniref:Fic/DOC family protein n=1 Tax=Branchiibius hedensis TaxID=672460 RepID=A0A2Y9BP13_9MICO|nr:Fic family protein [Branchiibius hedensis]PWJ23066.1 Fic/DOC family protein [Branchiibius hedensis]SSA59141.1 Fic/DOC family protein [Branchiibius hedensis]
MSEFDSWESYFYPETIDWTGNGTLRNNFGLRDADRLSDIEYAITARAAREWATTPHQDLGWGEARAKAIHKHLFHRIYEWAGEYRTVPIGKGQSRFAHPDEIPAVLQAVEGFVRSREWSELGRGGVRARCRSHVRVGQRDPRFP